MILILGSSFTCSSGARATWTHKSAQQHDNEMDPKRDSFLQHAWNSDQNVWNQEKMQVLQQNKHFFSWQNIKHLKQKMNVI